MLNYFNAIIFGFAQGITEFLPVSSSGHLIILHKLISLPLNNEITFDVALHFATFLAIFLYFYKDIWRLASAWVYSFKSGKSDDSRLAWQIIIGTIPAGLAGVFFEDIIENILRSPLVIVFMLILVGILFIIFEKISKQNLELKNLNLQKTLVIGCAQALALIPGTSRSGITIIAGLGTGLKREQALRFSFLLSLPVILGASITKIPLVFSDNIGSQELLTLLIAFASAFIFGMFAISFLMRYLKNNSLKVFAWYRFALAALILIYLYV